MGNARSLRIAVCAALALTAACASHGREVFVGAGCAQCHRFRGLGSPGPGPDLSDVGSRRDAAWIRDQVVEPAAHNPNARMPAFPSLGAYDRRSVSAFLTQR
jgi:cbb3-type cytochrome oxidase cytochrome c subunit